MKIIIPARAVEVLVYLGAIMLGLTIALIQKGGI
jgi:hypothetical protein